MPGPHPSVAATRVAVRAALVGLVGLVGPVKSVAPVGPVQPVGPVGSAGVGDPPLVLVACSGGADSLALAAAAAFEAPRSGRRAGAVVIDHGLQEGSRAVADAAAATCARLGLQPTLVETVTVRPDGSGPEAAARDARYRALEAVAGRLGAAGVLLGHTRDDQAEQVLLGLARGSGARSLAGMPARRGLLCRPFLALGREVTEQACAHQGLVPWVDPHNADERFARVRARRLVAALEAELGPGVAAALARSADLLRADDAALTGYAHDALAALRAEPDDPLGPWPVGPLRDLPPAVRGRVLRLLGARAGTGALGSAHVAALEALVADPAHGPVALPGGWVARRRAGRIGLLPPGQVE